MHVSAASLEPDRLYRVHLKEVPFAVSVVRRVFTNEDGSSGERYLMTSDETATSEALRAAYHRRWRVEEYHRSLKQNASLAKSPTRLVSERPTMSAKHLRVYSSSTVRSFSARPSSVVSETKS